MLLVYCLGYMGRFIKRRRLRGLVLKRLRVMLTAECYADLVQMKGQLGNGEAIEMLIRAHKARMERRRKPR